MHSNPGRVCTAGAASEAGRGMPIAHARLYDLHIAHRNARIKVRLHGMYAGLLEASLG